MRLQSWRLGTREVDDVPRQLPHRSAVVMLKQSSRSIDGHGVDVTTSAGNSVSPVFVLALERRSY